MQRHAPEAVDLSRESAETLRLYGADDRVTERMGRNCLLARRLVERGVRFVQLYCGSGSKWDAHSNVESNHSRYCRESDRPIAGLLRDLRARGLLDSTLVVWGGEFGRTPMSESGVGRDHNPWGFTTWLAGGGVKGGMTYGSTDEIGLNGLPLPTWPDGYHAVAWRADLLDTHADTLCRCFQGEIDAAVFPSLGNREGCVSLMTEISRRRAFIPEGTWLAVGPEGPC